MLANRIDEGNISFAERLQGRIASSLEFLTETLLLVLGENTSIFGRSLPQVIATIADRRRDVRPQLASI
jgi:hypothetical protein